MAKETYEIKLFNSRMKTTNKNIKDHISKNSTKNIRKNAILDPFLDEALEGFDAVPINKGDLKKLDVKMGIKGFWSQSMLLLASIIIIVFFFIGYNYKDNKPVNKTPEIITKTTVQKKDTSLFLKDDAVEFLPKQVVKNQKKLAKYIAESIEEEKVSLHTKPEISKIEYRPNFVLLEHTLTERENIAKETYINDFKVVDYRFYRKKPLQEKSNLETGVPANYENSRNSSHDIKDQIEYAYMVYLEKGIYNFSQGKYEKALSFFDQICITYPDDVNGLFYGALAAYNLQNFEVAEDKLTKLASNRFTNFEEARMWYLCLIYKSTNNHNKFIEYKKVIIAKDGFYAQKAKKLEE